MSPFHRIKILYIYGLVKFPVNQKKKIAPVTAASENDNIIRIAEVTDPAMQVFLPEQSVKNGAAVIVCPGGGYHILAWDLEGTEVAAWLNKNGYAAFVLQYRVPDKKAGALQDVQRAIRIVRKDAAKYGVDPEKIGVMGFSAGGSLTARASTLFNKQTYSPVDMADSLSCRPSFSMLIYPAYLDQGPEFSLTPELQLSSEVPPIFIFQTSDDQYGNSAIVMAQSLRNAKLPLNFIYYLLVAMVTGCDREILLLKHGPDWLKNGLNITYQNKLTVIK